MIPFRDQTHSLTWKIQVDLSEIPLLYGKFLRIQIHQVCLPWAAVFPVQVFGLCVQDNSPHQVLQAHLLAERLLWDPVLTSGYEQRVIWQGRTVTRLCGTQGSVSQESCGCSETHAEMVTSEFLIMQDCLWKVFCYLNTAIKSTKSWSDPFFLVITTQSRKFKPKHICFEYNMLV